MEATNPMSAEVARRWPGLCASMWGGGGCTAWGRAGCATVITNGGTCLFTLPELEAKAREWPAPKGRK